MVAVNLRSYELKPRDVPLFLKCCKLIFLQFLHGMQTLVDPDFKDPIMGFQFLKVVYFVTILIRISKPENQATPGSSFQI